MSKRKKDGSVDLRSESMRAIAKKSVAEGNATKRYTPDQVAAQIRLITDAWVEGATDHEIVRVINEAYKAGHIDHTIKRQRVRLLRERIQNKILQESEEDRPYTKARQARRLTKAIRECKGMRDQAGKLIEKPDHMSRARYEDMIARIEGNYEPIRIEVDAVHRHAIADVMASFSEEMMVQFEQTFDHISELATARAKEIGADLPDLLPKFVQSIAQNGSNGSSNGAPKL